jgi:transcriptional regulator with XRE-family HTH domain
MDTSLTDLQELKGIVGSRIRHYRQELDMTQEELGEKLHVTASSISMIERGHSIPSVRMLVDLARALRVPPTALLYHDQDVIVLPVTPLTSLSRESIDRHLRHADRELVGELLTQIDDEVRALEHLIGERVTPLLIKARLYQAAITQRWLQECDVRRDPESNEIKTVSDVAHELGGRYVREEDRSTFDPGELASVLVEKVG